MSKKSKQLSMKYNVDSIKEPTFIKNLKTKDLYTLASSVRDEIITVTSKTGGHLSSNLGVVELTIALHKNFDFSKDKLIFDVGHQSYTHKILTGRSIKGIRTKSGLSGFQKIEESIYDCYEAGHSSTSISAARGFAIARKLKNEDHDIVAVIGDSSFSNGLAFEGLNDIAFKKEKVIIILNDNEMSISKTVGGTSKILQKLSVSTSYNKFKERYKNVMLSNKFVYWIYKLSKKFKEFVKRMFSNNLFNFYGIQYIGPVDGHDFNKLNRALKAAKKSVKSVVVHVKTKKGYGYKPAELDTKGSWHGVSMFKIETGEQVTNNTDLVNWSEVISSVLLETMRKDKDIVVITPAMLTGSDLTILKDEFKDRVYDVGIAEEHAVTCASGIALGGKKPVVCMYSTFLQRAFDQINHDITRMNLNVTFLIDRSGFVGQDGSTHQGIFDESYLCSLPNTTVAMPTTFDEAKVLMDISLSHFGPFFIRYPRSKIDINFKVQTPMISYGKSITLKSSIQKDIAIVGVGPIIHDLNSQIIQKRLDIAVFNALFVNPIDNKMVKELLKFKKVIIYNAYATEEGFAKNLLAELEKLDYEGKVYFKCIPTKYIKHMSIEEQLDKYHLLPSDVISFLKDIRHD